MADVLPTLRSARSSRAGVKGPVVSVQEIHRSHSRHHRRHRRRVKSDSENNIDRPESDHLEIKARSDPHLKEHRHRPASLSQQRRRSSLGTGIVDGNGKRVSCGPPRSSTDTSRPRYSDRRKSQPSLLETQRPHFLR